MIHHIAVYYKVLQYYRVNRIQFLSNYEKEWICDLITNVVAGVQQR